MKKLIKIIIILLMIITLSIISLILLVDPNHYKDNIANQVEKILDHPFVIQGDISWQLWPKPGFSLHDAQLGQAPQVLQIKQLNAQVKFLPLLKKQLDLTLENTVIHWQDDITLENLHLTAGSITQVDKNKIIIDHVHIDSLDIDKIYFDLLALLTNPKVHIIIKDFTFDHFSLNKMAFEAIAMQMDINQGIITMKPFNAKLYSGDLSGEMTLDLTKSNPQNRIIAHLNQANLSNLLTYMAADNEITGSINLDMKVTASGLDSQIMQQHAQGQATIHIEQCIYHGKKYNQALIDTVTSANNLKDTGALLVDSVTLTSELIEQDKAGNKVTGQLTINHGLVDALDLMVNDQFPIKRYGPIDLPHQLITLCYSPTKK